MLAKVVVLRRGHPLRGGELVIFGVVTPCYQGPGLVGTL